MKRNNRHEGHFHRPFRGLKALLRSKDMPLAPFAYAPVVKQVDLDPSDPEYENKLFQAAMADVTPLPRDNSLKTPRDINPARKAALQSVQRQKNQNRVDPDSLKRLKQLVENGRGFVVAQTPEYIEGRVYCDNPEITARLHRGDFSIQAHIDLHGLSVESAQDAFDQFLKESLRAGKRAVLVIHGRGLSSPHQPILKNKVQDWLTRGPWRKWIIAFTSAPAHDGGAGGTYILLRERPCTKRMRKKFTSRTSGAP